MELKLDKMIVVVCQDTYEETGWGTYTNQYSKILNSFDEIIIICHKKINI